jgi:3-oxoacyl-[acyl-carrier-protein] synthase II
MSIKEVFGTRAARIPVGTKPYTGHPLARPARSRPWSAPCADRGWVPLTLSWENPDPACDLDVVPQHGRDASIDHVLSNSFGFGGINACIVLGRVPADD